MSSSNLTNQNPEQIDRDTIDKQLVEAGWAVQKKTDLDFNYNLIT